VYSSFALFWAYGFFFVFPGAGPNTGFPLKTLSHVLLLIRSIYQGSTLPISDRVLLFRFRKERFFFSLPLAASR
jgi:hypothetical protein